MGRRLKTNLGVNNRYTKTYLLLQITPR